MQKILSNHATVNPEENTHSLVLKLVIYFLGIGYELEQALHDSREWLSSRVSNTYGSGEGVRQHFVDTWHHIEHQPEYKFVCAAMRNAVESPLCAVCPFNKDAAYSEDDPFWNVSLWNQQYCVSRSTKDGVQRSNVTSWVLEPVKAGIPLEHFKDPRREKLWSSFKAWVRKRGETPCEVVIHKDDLKGVKELAESIQSQVSIGVGYCDTRPIIGSGIREIIMKQMQGLPHYLDAGASQGMYQYKGRWYWADSAGTRDSEWQESDNVFVDAAMVDRRMAFDLSSSSPVNPNSLASLVDRIQKVNEPEVIFPLLAYTSGCFFNQRFKKIAESQHRENLKNFPCLYLEGLANSGKSETVNNLIRKIFGAVDDMEELAGKTPFVLRAKIIPTSNTCPVFLDEVKEDMVNNREATAVGPVTLKEIIRSSWDSSEYMRGDYQSESLVRKFTTDCPLFLAGPSLPSAFDQAMQDRMVLVRITQAGSQARKQEWLELLQECTGTRKLQAVGHLILTQALLWSDEMILEVYDQAVRAAGRYQDSIVDRKFASLVKLFFGAMVWASLWEGFDLETALTSCLSAVGITVVPEEEDGEPGSESESEDDETEERDETGDDDVYDGSVPSPLCVDNEYYAEPTWTIFEDSLSDHKLKEAAHALLLSAPPTGRPAWEQYPVIEMYLDPFMGQDEREWVRSQAACDELVHLGLLTEARSEPVVEKTKKTERVESAKKTEKTELVEKTNTTKRVADLAPREIRFLRMWLKNERKTMILEYVSSTPDGLEHKRLSDLQFSLLAAMESTDTDSVQRNAAEALYRETVSKLEASAAAVARAVSALDKTTPATKNLLLALASFDLETCRGAEPITESSLERIQIWLRETYPCELGSSRKRQGAKVIAFQVEARADDWDRWFADALAMCSPKAALNVRLNDRRDYWFTQFKGRHVFVLDVTQACANYQAFCRMTGSVSVRLSLQQILQIAQTKGVSAPLFGGKATSTGATPPGSNVPFPGTFLALDVQSLQNPERVSAVRYSFLGVPGFDPGLASHRPADGKAKLTLEW